MDTGQGLSTPAEQGLHVSTGNQQCRWRAGHGTEFGNPAWLFLFVVRVSIHRRGRNAGSSVTPKEAITGIYPGLIMETPQHSPSLRWKGHFLSQAVGSGAVAGALLYDLHLHFSWTRSRAGMFITLWAVPRTPTPLVEGE